MSSSTRQASSSYRVAQSWRRSGFSRNTGSHSAARQKHLYSVLAAVESGDVAVTRILRLEMKGFKSFANKTEIVFGPAFNCILGPNGSGKSNVLDAICFVLGKASAKGLRAEKSANLIYNGGKRKSPAKSGEVSIVFSNENKLFGEQEELKITRIVKQTGQSVYKLNGEVSSRQEILDTLSKDRIDPDGYNIILQGDINHLIEMSTQQRRGIVEEIAGINLYEEKKEKALRELGRVEQKLNEADIVLAERKAYLQELKKERDQALKFKELDEKIKRNKVTLIVNKKQQRTQELEKLEKKAARQAQELEKLVEKRAKLAKEIAERREEIERINKEVERRGEKEQVQLHKEVEALKVELAVNAQRVESVTQELAKLDERKAELERTHNEHLEKIRRMEKERADIEKRIKLREEGIAKLEQRIQEFRKKHNMEDASKLDQQIEALDKEADGLQEEIARLREQQQELVREKDRVEIKLEQIDEKIAKVLAIKSAHKQELEALQQKKQAFKKATKELNTALTEDSSIVAQLQTARQKLLSRKEELAKVEAQQSNIRERIAGGQAIERIMELKRKGTIKGIHGTVSELGQVREQYALALEIAAGGRINSIVVDTDEVAARCIKHLREHKLGVATFLPMNKLRAPPSAKLTTKNKAVVGLCTELVSHDPRYAKVFQFVFGNTVVVDTLEHARKLGVGSMRMVTLKGDLIETSGAMQGGFRARRRGLGFQQKEASEKLEKLRAEIADLEQVIGRLEHKRHENEELITRLRELKATLEGEIIKTEKSLHIDSEDAGLSKDEKQRLQKQLAQLDERINETTNKLGDATTQLGQLKIQKQQLRDQMNALRSPTVLAELNTFEEKKAELKNEIGELTAELRTSESEVTKILGPEAERVAEILKQQERERKAFEKELQTLKASIAKQEKELKAKEKQEQKFFSQFKELFTKRNKLEEEIRKREGQTSELQARERELEHQNTAFSVERARLKAELAGLEEEERQYEGVEPYPTSEKSEEDIKLEVREFERLVENIGAVNMKALEIYEQVEQEYASLMKKKETLGTEREDVLVMINEIDAKKRELFLRTFEVVNENFKHFFGRLSKKGQAFLELEDAKDPFNGGLTIKVRLTGKKYLDIRSLSGGEKTMTALAFLFAVQEHEPASFYILDEVDAALDKHNSQLLAKLIREYCERAQYIIISHNDGVISEADTLYGVSMNEHGISKITSLRL
ncbi:chromosome segregation protein SMC [Candidatus Woesearchaeota archaeon]|nr:MAG: chromosome segregation protein SMC [Candidatus Woesearchaeota archaeon]